MVWLTLRAAAPLRPGRRLTTLLSTGMHWGQDAIDRYDTQFPLEVGNYWRYRIEKSAAPPQADSEASATPLGALQQSTEVVDKVVSVQRLDLYHLVHLQREYDDPGLTQKPFWWLVTARQINICDRQCRRRADDLGWVLDHLATQSPLLRFQHDGASSHRNGKAHSDGPFQRTHTPSLHVPAGFFPATYALDGQGRIGIYDSNFRADLTRFFAPGTGIVKRELRPSSSEKWTLDLTDYRLMPRH